MLEPRLLLHGGGGEDPLHALSAVENFDDQHIPYELRRHDRKPGPYIGRELAGTNVLRLGSAVLGNNNSIAFERTAIGAYGNVQVQFDFRIVADGEAADGLGFEWLNTAVYGASGVVAPGQPSNVPEDPNFIRSLGIGLDTAFNADLGDVNGNHASIHAGATTIAQRDLAALNLNLESGVWHHALVEIEQDNSSVNVSLALQPAGGLAVQVFDHVQIPDFSAYEGRAWFGARTGGQVADHDIDEIAIDVADPLASRVELYADTYTVVENEQFTTVVVTLDVPQSVPVTVNYASAAGTAAADVDFDDAAGSVTFAPGETWKPIRIPIVADDVREPTETFQVTLTSVAPDGNTTLGTRLQADIRLVDDDNPGAAGSWALPPEWGLTEVENDRINTEVVAVHAHVLPDGRVMYWNGDTGEGDEPSSTFENPRVWVPGTGTTTPLSSPPHNLFCAGHSFLSDGRLLVTGGHELANVGLSSAAIYDPANNSWQRLPGMNAPRWYPTNTTLPSGDILVVSGEVTPQVVNPVPQVWETEANRWRDLPNAELAMHLYPFMFVAPDGRVFNAGPNQDSQFLDTAGDGSWTHAADSLFGIRSDGSAAMLADGQVILVGGAPNGLDFPTNTAEVIALGSSNPQWQFTNSMAFPRKYHNATILADGTLLVTGGSAAPGFNDGSAAVRAAELWDPVTGEWKTLAASQAHRLYHATGLLLPDGRVFVSGGGQPAASVDGVRADNLDAEIFSPPYLFDDNGNPAVRPEITRAPTVVRYGDDFIVHTPDGDQTAAVNWVRLSSVTHAFNENQRINRLGFRPVPGGLSVAAPSDPNLAPPGHYMLFVVDDNGVPSEAAIVQIVATPDAPAPPALSDLAGFLVDVLPVSGRDNNVTGVAAAGPFYAATESFEETFEIRNLAEPHRSVVDISLAELRSTFSVPGGTSGGPDGMTSVTAHENAWYVVATSEGTDAIFKIAADGSTRELFSTVEIHGRGDLPFNRSEIEFYENGRSFLAHSSGLDELDENGQHVRRLATGNYDGVAVVGDSLFAIQDNGLLVADVDLTDGDRSVVALANLGETVLDLTWGEFGTLGEALFVTTQAGELAYWRKEDLLASTPLAPPSPLLQIPNLFGKIAFHEGALFISRSSSVVRVRENSDVRFEVVEPTVTVTEGSAATQAIRLHLTKPPNWPIEVGIGRVSGDEDIIVADRTYIFDKNNWRADAYIELKANDDADRQDGLAIVRISAPGMTPLDVVVNERDDDGVVGIELDATNVAIREGRTASFRARLTAAPSAPVIVSTQWSGGDADLFVEGHAEVEFDASNWDRWRWVSLGAGQDGDTSDGSAVFTVSAAGLATQPLTATEVDAGEVDTQVSYTVLVDDYTALPLQGEQEEFAFFNRVRGDRGKIDPAGVGVVDLGPGFVEARTLTDAGFAGMFNSVNHALREGQPLDFKALLPARIQAEFQYQATSLRFEIEDGQGRFDVELVNPEKDKVFTHSEFLTGGPVSLRIPLEDPPNQVQGLNWLIVGDAGSFVRIKRIELEVQGPNLGYLEGFLWPYAALLSNYSETTGLTRDRAAFPEGDFDGVNTSGGQAAAAAVAAKLGVISVDAAREIVSGTASALLELQANDSLHGVLPHFVRTNFVIDNESSEFQVVSGDWESANSVEGCHGQDHLQIAAGTGDAKVQWTPRITRGGTYEVFTRWVDGSEHATNARFTIETLDGVKSEVVDQTQGGGKWHRLGVYDFAPGEAKITLTDDADGVVIADAIRLVGPPHIVPHTEYSTVDSVIGLLGTLLAAEALDLPTEELEQAIRKIDWNAATLPDQTISHGFRDDGQLLPNGWDFFGGEAVLVALAHVAATGRLPAIPHIDLENLQTFNGSGFIDELLWVFVEPIGIDAYGADWDSYRPAAAATQVAHYDQAPYPLFGASAAEPPILSQFPVRPGDDVAIPYVPFGVGGLGPANDGSDLFAGQVAAPHYAGMAWSLAPAAAQRMWDAMQDQGILSPLNLVESVVVQQWGSTLETHWHAFKGSWNLALQALGAGSHLLQNANPLFDAARTNSFLSSAMQLLAPHEPAELRGSVFNDVNRNALRDSNEVGIDGVAMELVLQPEGTVVQAQVTASRDLDGDGLIDPFAEQGLYEFLDVQPGRYAVRQATREGWEPTSPAEVSYVLSQGLPVSDPHGLATFLDLDGDQYPDFVVPDGVTQAIGVYRNRGDGSYARAPDQLLDDQPVNSTHFNDEFTQSIVADDFNGDGTLDLAVIANDLRILLNLGDGQFSAPISYYVGDSLRGVIAADLNGDDFVDIAVLTNKEALPELGRVAVFLNNGDGTFTALLDSPVQGGRLTSVTASDFDGDGDVDLAVIANLSGGIRVLQNDGNGLLVPGPFYGATGAQSLRSADLNADGFPDLVFASLAVSSGPDNQPRYSNQVVVLPNRGDGTFATPISLPVGTLPTSVDIGDIDGDGDPDLAVAYRGTIESDGGLAILFNDGLGKFELAADISPPNSPLAIRLSDMDLDGDQDLLAADRETSQFLEFQNTEKSPGTLPGSHVVTVSSSQVFGGIDLGSAQKTLELAFAVDEVAESGNHQATTGTITRRGENLATALAVSLVSDPANQLVIPASVEIPANQASVDFLITAFDDTVVDGLQVVTMTASAAGHLDATGTLRVVDDDVPELTLAIAEAEISEDGGRTQATVTRNSVTSSSLEVAISSSDRGEATVPASITIPSGSNSATFTITGQPDSVFDQTQVVNITVAATEHTSAVETLNVTNVDPQPPNHVMRVIVRTFERPKHYPFFDHDGNPQTPLQRIEASVEIDTIREGQDFVVKLLVEDIRPAGSQHGVFASYVDLNFDGALASLVADLPFVTHPQTNEGTPFLHNTQTPQGVFGARAEPVNGTGLIDTNSDGVFDQIDLLGSFSNLLDGTGGGEVLLVEWAMTAVNAGILTLAAEPTTEAAADDPHDLDQSPLFDSGVFGQDEAVCPSEGDGPCQGSIQFQDAVIVIENSPPHQNPRDRLDVNNDCVVAPIDALVAINFLNKHGAISLADPSVAGLETPPFVDVNGDGFATPNDPLQIINFLNSVSSGAGENVASTMSASEHPGSGNLAAFRESHDSPIVHHGVDALLVPWWHPVVETTQSLSNTPSPQGRVEPVTVMNKYQDHVAVSPSQARSVQSRVLIDVLDELAGNAFRSGLEEILNAIVTPVAPASPR